MTHCLDKIAEAESLYFDGNSNCKAAGILGLSVSTQNQWVKNYEETGTFGPINLKGLNYAIDEHSEFIHGLLEEKFDITLEDIRSRLFIDRGFECSLGTITEFLSREGVPSPAERRRICREREKLERQHLASVNSAERFGSDCMAVETAADGRDFVEWKVCMEGSDAGLGSTPSGHSAGSIVRIIDLVSGFTDTAAVSVAGFSERIFDVLGNFIAGCLNGAARWCTCIVEDMLCAGKLLAGFGKSPGALTIAGIFGFSSGTGRSAGSFWTLARTAVGNLGLKDASDGVSNARAWLVSGALDLQTRLVRIIQNPVGKHSWATIRKRLHGTVGMNPVHFGGSVIDTDPAHGSDSAGTGGRMHPQEVRDSCFEFKGQGRTQLESSDLAGVSHHTAKKCHRHHSETGSTMPKGRPVGKIEQYKDEIEAHLYVHRSITLPKLALDMEKIGLSCDSSTYSKHMDAWGWEKIGGEWCKPALATVCKPGYGQRNTAFSACADFIADRAMEAMDKLSMQKIADLVNKVFTLPTPCTRQTVEYHLTQRGILPDRSSERPEPANSGTMEPVAAARGSESSKADDRKDMEKPLDPDSVVFRLTGAINDWRKSNPDIGSEDIIGMLRELHGVNTSAEVVERVLRGRVITPYAEEILSLKESEADISLTEIAKRIMDQHSQPTSASTVGRLLNDYGVELKLGRKPKKKESTRILVVNGKRTELPPLEEPKTNVNAALNRKMPSVAQFRIAADGLVSALREAGGSVGFTDPRSETNVQYCPFKVLALMLVAKGAGKLDLHTMDLYVRANANLFKQVFNMQKLPSKSVMDTLLRKMDPIKLGSLVMLVTARVHLQPDETYVVAIDGKTLCGLLAYDNIENNAVATGFEVNSKQILAVMPSDKGGRELQAARDLCAEIRRLWDPKHIFVTLDALHGDRKTMVELHLMGIHICVVIKRNKKTLSRTMHGLASRAKHQGHYVTSEKNRTRDESRMYQAYYKDQVTGETWNSYFKDEEIVPEFGMIVVVTSYRNGVEEPRIVYFSKVISVVDAAEYIRQHWYVENKVHHTLDVSYDEDDMKAHTENSPMCHAILNRGNINLVQRSSPGARNSDKRHVASCNPEENLAIILNDYLPA